MSLSERDAILIDFEDPTVKDSASTVIEIFKQIGPKLVQLHLLNAEDQIFPVKIVDAYLRKHLEKIKNVTHLSLKFDPCSSVQLLKMVASRFPKVERLDLTYSSNHPVEHALTQLFRLPNLIEVHLGFRIKDLYEFMQTHPPFAPFTKMEILHWERSHFADDNYQYFEATIPVLFPNLIELDFTCPSKAFADKVEENVRRLFPSLKRCQALDVGDLLEENSTRCLRLLL